MYDLKLGDCFKLLDEIPDKSVDLILTDPPYNIAKYSTGNIDLPGRSALNNDLGDWDKKEIEPKDLLENFKRIIKPKGNIFIFTTYNQIGKCMKFLTQNLIPFNLWFGTKQILHQKFIRMDF